MVGLFCDMLCGGILKAKGLSRVNVVFPVCIGVGLVLGFQLLWLPVLSYGTYRSYIVLWMIPQKLKL